MINHPSKGMIPIYGYENSVQNGITDDLTGKKIDVDEFRFSNSQFDWDIKPESLNDIEKSTLGAMNLILVSNGEEWSSSGKLLIPSHLMYCVKQSNGIQINNSNKPNICLSSMPSPIDGNLYTITLR